MAEYAYGILGEAHPKEIVDAAQLLCQQKKAAVVPTVVAAAKLFFEKQEQRQLSEATMRDYRRLMRFIEKEFGEQRLSELTSQSLCQFIERPSYLAGKRSRYIYTKAFIQFCAGKHNSHCNGTPWVSPQVLQWQAPKSEAKDVSIYSFDEIVTLLTHAQRRGVLPYFVFRLFSMMRTEEMKRFIAIHPKVAEHPLISLEARRISITNHLFNQPVTPSIEEVFATRSIRYCPFRWNTSAAARPQVCWRFPRFLVFLPQLQLTRRRVVAQLERLTLGEFDLVERDYFPAIAQFHTVGAGHQLRQLLAECTAFGNQHSLSIEYRDRQIFCDGCRGRWRWRWDQSGRSPGDNSRLERRRQL